MVRVFEAQEGTGADRERGRRLSCNARSANQPSKSSHSGLMSASSPSRSPRLRPRACPQGSNERSSTNRLPELLGEDVCLLHPRLGYDSGPGGGDFDFAVREIDLQWPLRATGARVCQCIRHSPGGWYWVVETPDDVFAIDALDDPHGIGQLNFPTALAFEADDRDIAAIRAAFVTMKRLVKRMRGRAKWDPIIAMAGTDPRSYAKCLEHAWGAGSDKGSVARYWPVEYPMRGSGEGPSYSLRLRRIRTPQRAAILLLRSMERLVGRFGHPTGLLVVVVGPDGAGKSALASSLMARCGVFFWKSRRIHWRPSLLPRLGAFVGGRPTDPETPHRSTPHGRMTSIAVLLYYWVDFLLGTWLKLNPLRVRSALIVVERGWWDILVDPRRYRLQVPPGLTAALGRLLPNPDLTLVLDAPAAALAAAEAGAAEDRARSPAQPLARARRTGSGLLLAG